MITTPSGIPVAYALTSAKADGHDTALAMIHLDAALQGRDGQKLMADKGYRSATVEVELNDAGITLIRPTARGEKIQRLLTKFLARNRPGPSRSLIAYDH